MNKTFESVQNNRDDSKKWERSFSFRISVLLVVATCLLIGQSAYNISSIDDVDESINIVNESAFKLDDLSQNIMRPIADIRIISMELVSAPSRQRLNETKVRLDFNVHQLEKKLEEWQAIFQKGGKDDERSGSVCLNSRVWFYKWIPTLVMPPPVLATVH